MNASFGRIGGQPGCWGGGRGGAGGCGDIAERGTVDTTRPHETSAFPGPSRRQSCRRDDAGGRADTAERGDVPGRDGTHTATAADTTHARQTSAFPDPSHRQPSRRNDAGRRADTAKRGHIARPGNVAGRYGTRTATAADTTHARQTSAFPGHIARRGDVPGRYGIRTATAADTTHAHETSACSGPTRGSLAAWMPPATATAPATQAARARRAPSSAPATDSHSCCETGGGERNPPRAATAPDRSRGEGR